MGRAERLIAAARAKLEDGGAALPAWPILAVLCATSAITLVVLGAQLGFFNDEWYILYQRPGLNAHSVLDPHNEHLIALPVLIYKALIATVGVDHQLPYRMLLAATVVALAVCIFLFVRERAGQLLALVAAAIVLFLGPAWEDLLWSFQIGFVGSLATGVAVLLALQEDSPRRNAVACALLVVSILFSDLGIPFVAAAVVAVLLRRRPSELWVPGVATLVFAIWWIGYGHTAQSQFGLDNVSRAPFYVLDSVGAGLASLTGLLPHSEGTIDPYSWGRPLLALAVVGVFVWLYRGGRPSRYLLVVGAAALTFWALAAFNFVDGRQPHASRYQLVDVTFLILLAAELFRPVHLRPGVLAAVAGLSVIAIGANIGTLISGYNFFRDDAVLVRADLGALQITNGRAPPQFELVQDVAHTPYLGGVTSGRYFEETAAHGSPPFDSPAELANASSEAQQAADNVLAAGYAVALTPLPQEQAAAGGPGCRRLAAGFDGGPTDMVLPPGGATVTNLGQTKATIGVRRFAPAGMPINLGELVGGFAARIDVPGDSVPTPWRLETSGGAPLEVCP